MSKKRPGAAYMAWRMKMGAYSMFGMGLVLFVAGAVNGKVAAGVGGVIFSSVLGLGFLGARRFFADMADGWADTGGESSES